MSLQSHQESKDHLMLPTFKFFVHYLPCCLLPGKVSFSAIVPSEPAAIGDKKCIPELFAPQHVDQKIG